MNAMREKQLCPKLANYLFRKTEMKTPISNGTIDVKLYKSETTAAQKTMETCTTLASMRPLPPGVNELAGVIATSLGKLLSLIGDGTEPYRPLLEGTGDKAPFDEMGDA